MHQQTLRISSFPSVPRLASAAFFLAICITLLLPQPSFASETDQFRLPPKPLADIGDEVSEHVEDVLRKAIKKINSEIAAHKACLVSVKNTEMSGCLSAQEEAVKLEFLRSNDAVAQEVYRGLGTGFLLFTKSGTWMELHRFRRSPSRYKPKYWKSIFIFSPVNNLTTSSTVNLYGVLFGTDKLEHIFQQGHQYYKDYNSAIAKGATHEEARRRVINWGQSTERTFFGTLVSGVYSNADLYANYAGLKFYQGLTQPIRIGDEVRPATLLLIDGAWEINETISLKEFLLKPFISDHLNEALNPSVYAKGLGLLNQVRSVVRKRDCGDWLKKFPNRTQFEWYSVSQGLTRWHGFDYGFTNSSQVVTIANTCFADESKELDNASVEAEHLADGFVGLTQEAMIAIGDIRSRPPINPVQPKRGSWSVNYTF